MSSDTREALRRFVPPILVELVGLVRKTVEWLGVRRHLRANAALRGAYAGRAVYVLANGPSLGNVDLASLLGECVITMNHFELHPLAHRFQPVAHCIGDPLAEWSAQDPAPMVRGVDAATYWVNADSVSVFSAFADKRIHYYHQAIRNTARHLRGDDLAGLALQYQSTAQMAIMVALYLGFERIYLLGFDHDWLVTRGHSAHFYEEREGVAPADQSVFSYTERIVISLNLFRTYAKIARLAASSGVRIVNLSRPTYLDVFPMTDAQAVVRPRVERPAVAHADGP